MQAQTLLDALAESLRGEMDGITLYKEAAARSDGDVREFFNERVEEEKLHYNWLLDYFQQVSLGGMPMGSPASRGKEHTDESKILSKEFLKQIGEAQYLTTAISASILLEYTALKHYKKCADETGDPTVKELFEELYQWETDHYDVLLKIQESSKQYWFDVQKFEPF